MALTLAQIRSDLTEAYAARRAIMAGQTVSMNGRTLSRASLPDIEATITRLERQERRAQNVAAGRSPLGASVARFR